MPLAQNLAVPTICRLGGLPAENWCGSNALICCAKMECAELTRIATGLEMLCNAGHVARHACANAARALLVGFKFNDFLLLEEEEDDDDDDDNDEKEQRSLACSDSCTCTGRRPDCSDERVGVPGKERRERGGKICIL